MARYLNVPECDVEDAAQYTLERLWVDGDWSCADSTVLWRKTIDWIRQQTGRWEDSPKRRGLKDTVPMDDDRWYKPDFAITFDSYPCLTEIPVIPYTSRTCDVSTDKKNFAIAAIAIGIQQNEIAEFLGMTEGGVVHMLRACRKYIKREDLLPEEQHG